MADTSFLEGLRGAATEAGRPLEGRSVPRRGALIVLAVVVLLYATGIHGRWWPSLDSASYLVLGRSIAAGEGYVFNGRPDNTFPPGLPMLLAGVHRLVGENYWIFNTLIVLSALGALGLMYACLKRMTDPASALLITAMTALAYRFFLNASRILTDIPMALLVWLAIYACMRLGRGRWAWLLAIPLLSVATVLFRAAGLLVMGALAVGLLLDARLFGSWRRRLAGAFAAAVPAMATILVLYALATHMSDEQPRYESFVEQTAGAGEGMVESYLGQFMEALSYWPVSMGDLMTAQSFRAYGWVLIALWLVGLATSIVRREGFWPAMCVLYPAGLLMVTWVENALRSRFLIVIQPLILLGVLQGLAAVCILIARRFRADPQNAGRRLVNTTVAILAIVTVGTNVPRLARAAYINGYAARTDRFHERVEKGSYADIIAVADAVGEMTKPGTSVIAADDVVGLTHYRSGRLTIPWPVEDERTVEAAQSVYALAAGRSDVAAVILPVRAGDETFAESLRSGFDADPAWRKATENKSYVAYVRWRE